MLKLSWITLIYKLVHDESVYELNDRLFNTLSDVLTTLRKADFKDLQVYKVDGDAYMVINVSSNSYGRA
jgi:hypothetical protein